jgi:hypothetical protein
MQTLAVESGASGMDGRKRRMAIVIINTVGKHVTRDSYPLLGLMGDIVSTLN